MASIELLKAMDPAHAINALRADFDPLINTPLEAYLIDWLEQCCDGDNEDQPLVDAAEEYDFEPEDIKTLGDALIEDVNNTAALLNAIGETDITRPEELKQALNLVAVLDGASIDTPEKLQSRLDLADQFRALASDAGDVFSRLTQLTTTVQE